ncbi:uncharacterized protein PFL1_02143 [Pseudozyma flocculosa PF-1]|uniref:PLD phosphodiesterase domain-containing protein n=1 Tax=Pseudozyma flocculosa TaxID=84751 RepID=A0A5C3EZK6_9BASI|nr:uncharacterized protein PFL1_02143 [Pseudozyma flocculosa PF-1]EPQ30619.1 hypothetical protein PFL1_02143 [Pseudozyma flocculosa PF-1]SPO37713.1 uncharacterized protein PSFLO_03189 [Pseudozyma flocculosa]
MICGSSSKATREGAQHLAHTSAGADVGTCQDARPQSQQATITSAVAADPTLPPSKAAEILFPPPSAARRGLLRFTIKEQLEEGRGKHWVWDKGAVHDGNREPDDDELERVRLRYGYKELEKGGPSRLYLMMLADCLLPLPRNPMSGVVSPPLLATTGIAPLSIFSTGPDIIGHYYDCIVAARKEVILLTNYWQGGKNVDKIAEALRELDRRVQKRRRQAAATAARRGRGRGASPESGRTGDSGASTPAVAASEAEKQAARLTDTGAPGSAERSEGDKARLEGDLDEVDVDEPGPDEKVVVKLMWDRGPQTLADLFRLRKPVPPGMWKTNGLPEEHEIPNLTMEILNYHRPLMGTFHAKLLIVDRQVALINSNNIQDRPNIEACVRFEGDIVNSIYDHALISWGNRLQPPLPCLSIPAPVAPSPSAFMTGKSSTLPSMSPEKMREMARNARQQLKQDDEATEDEKERSLVGGLHLGDVVDQMMRRDSYSQLESPTAGGGGAAAAAAAATPVGGASAGTPTTSPTADGGSAAGVDSEKAARKAGAIWAHKVLGERFGGSGQHGKMGAGGAEHGDPAAATGAPRPRNFAEVVDALMKMEGIKPGGWADGALEVFGLGPSSSRNVANEVRRNPRPRNLDAAARGLRIPKPVKEEEGLHRDEARHDGAGPRPAAAAAAAKLYDQNNAGSHEALSTTVVDGDLSPRLDSSGLHDDDRDVDKAKAVRDPALVTVSHVDGHHDASQPAPPLVVAPASADSSKLEVPGAREQRGESAVADDDADAEGDGDGAPGSVAYRRIHRRTLSNLSRSSGAERLSAITKALDFANNSKVKGEITADDLADRALEAAAADALLDFQPYTFHQPHEPVPMALVNRRPHGTPGHSDIRNPQDAAWLAGFRYAKEHVFIQSPTLNASPIKAAVLACVRRHVRVELWLDLGFNDKSESMPFQGGTNEQVVTGFYRQLRREGKGDERYLEVYWYTGKDMTRPLNAVRKQRNCHVKFAAIDGQVAILGSGNQDTQSWFHSQEINVMVDSRQIVAEWMDALRRNQSTHLYGKVDQRDGVWRGRTGAEIADTGKDRTSPQSEAASGSTAANGGAAGGAVVVDAAPATGDGGASSGASAGATAGTEATGAAPAPAPASVAAAPTADASAK